MKLNILSRKIAWFGKHSGYEALTDFFPLELDVNVITIGNTFLGKLIGKFIKFFFRWEKKNAQDTFAELRLICSNASKRLSHVLYLEGHLDMIKRFPNRKKLIATLHLPIAEWDKQRLSALGQLEHLILLYTEEIEQFSKYIPKERIHFIRHGVNIDFFKPDPDKKVIKNKVLIVGHYLRNFDMLYKVYITITTEFPEVEFHIVIPAMFRKLFPEIVEMSEKKNVFFHQKLSDQELLEQYQESNVLLIPMNNSGANTAIVQSLAIGLPIITTDVGGIRSYGGGQVFPIVENNDVEGMILLFKKYYNDNSYRNNIAIKQREFAVQYLNWNLIALQHLNFYKSIEN